MSAALPVTAAVTPLAQSETHQEAPAADATSAGHPACSAQEAAQILAEACRRSVEGGYAGAVTPPEAWRLFHAGHARLIDVRTEAELRYVGRVPGAQHAEWHGKDPLQVERFIATLRTLATPGEPVLLLCRSAVRSHHAGGVAAQAGYTQVFNVLEGFEGQRDHAQQRGHVDGWRRHGLPWVQD